MTARGMTARGMTARGMTARGMTAMELVVVMALTASLAAMLVSGLASLRRATTLETARHTLRLALRQAATLAYRSAATVELRPLAGGSGLRIGNGRGATTIDLPRGVRVVGMPRRGGVRFFASGLADNATFVVALESSGESRKVVVNQRGLIR